MAKKTNFDNPGYVIQSWLRNRNTIGFLSIWETENNPNFDKNAAEALLEMSHKEIKSAD